MKVSEHIDLRRFLPLLAVGIPLACILLGIDVLARKVFVGKNDAPPPRVSWEHINLAGVRMAGVERAAENGGFGENGLVVVFGASSVRLDLDARVLAENDSENRDWIVLGTAGFDVAQLEPSSWSLLNSTVLPVTVVLGLHMTMLSNPETPSEEPEGLKQRVIDVLHRNSFLAHNRYIRRSSTLPLRVHRWKTLMAGKLDHGMVSLFAPSDEILDVWEWSVSKGKDQADAAHMEKQRASFTRIADAENFPPVNRNPNVRILADIARELRSRGVTVVIALMPEHPDWRKLQPEDVANYWAKALAAIEHGGEPLLVLDFRDAYGTDYFFDLAHLNRSGQLEFSTQFADALPRR